MNVLQLYVLCSDSKIDQMLRTMMERKLMHVVLFSEQARFLNFIQRIKTGLILLDFDMGSICGIEVIRQLRCCNIALSIN